MATKKKVKPVEEKTVIEVIKPTDEELFLGAEEEVKEVKVIDYTAFERLYKVTNLKRNRNYTLNGIQIGAILGMDYEARKQLKEGAKKVVMRNKDNEETYKIEVL